MTRGRLSPVRLALAAALFLGSVGFVVWRWQVASGPEGVVAWAPDTRTPEEIARESEAHRANMLSQFDLSNLRVGEVELVLGGPPKDGIMALTNPQRIRAAAYDALNASERVIEFEHDGIAVAYPILMLTAHEIINDEVGDLPVAVTYCPLCDSAMVFDRRVEHDGEAMILEFGVSGLLINSNVVMYDRTHDGLWSQLAMESISGPMSGTPLRVLPVEVTTYEQFRIRHPEGEVVSLERDGARLPYETLRRMYGDALHSDTLRFPVPKEGKALPRKTLGLGVIVGEETYFVPAEAAADEPFVLSTTAGAVVVESDNSGVRVISKPDSVGVVQTFYYAWSAWHPDTIIVCSADDAQNGG